MHQRIRRAFVKLVSIGYFVHWRPIGLLRCVELGLSRLSFADQKVIHVSLAIYIFDGHGVFAIVASSKCGRENRKPTASQHLHAAAAAYSPSPGAERFGALGS